MFRVFCTKPLSMRQVKGQPFRLIPRCVITQSSGKQGVIDNADHGSQSELSSDTNKLVPCSALRPAQHVSAAMLHLSPEEANLLLETDRWEGGGENWPDAYRHCPMAEDQSRCCVVVWWHRDWGKPAYQISSGLLFGLPLAVTSFNRLSRFTESVGLLGAVLPARWSPCTSTTFEFRLRFRSASLLRGQSYDGFPFAEEKRQAMATFGTFLGLDWDFRLLQHRGSKLYGMHFLPRSGRLWSYRNRQASNPGRRGSMRPARS